MLTCYDPQGISPGQKSGPAYSFQSRTAAVRNISEWKEVPGPWPSILAQVATVWLHHGADLFCLKSRKSLPRYPRCVRQYDPAGLAGSPPRTLEGNHPDNSAALLAEIRESLCLMSALKS
jgi:hypothetical protein